jgi:hypothetical protein
MLVATPGKIRLNQCTAFDFLHVFNLRVDKYDHPENIRSEGVPDGLKYLQCKCADL